MFLIYLLLNLRKNKGLPRSKVISRSTLTMLNSYRRNKQMLYMKAFPPLSMLSRVEILQTSNTCPQATPYPLRAPLPKLLSTCVPLSQNRIAIQLRLLSLKRKRVIIYTAMRHPSWEKESSSMSSTNQIVPRNAKRGILNGGEEYRKWEDWQHVDICLFLHDMNQMIVTILFDVYSSSWI